MVSNRKIKKQKNKSYKTVVIRLTYIAFLKNTYLW